MEYEYITSSHVVIRRDLKQKPGIIDIFRVGGIGKSHGGFFARKAVFGLTACKEYVVLGLGFIHSDLQGICCAWIGIHPQRLARNMMCLDWLLHRSCYSQMNPV